MCGKKIAMNMSTSSENKRLYLHQDVVKLTAENEDLKAAVAHLQNKLGEALSQIDWFKRQVFGKTSEKFVPVQFECLPLFSGKPATPETETEKEEEEVVVTRRKRGQTKDLGTNTESGLRIGDGVEIVSKEVYPDEVKGLSAEEYEVIDREISDRLFSRKSKRVVLRRVYMKVKIKTQSQEHATETSNTSVILKATVPAQVLNRSYMSESFLVDMILDKILYAMPLYRQHQRLEREGIYISRGSMVSNFIKACSLMSRVVEAQRVSILSGSKIAIDETPMRVGVDKQKRQMKKGYVWPIYGELDEIVYHYNKSRSARVVGELIGGFKGTILTDGYPGYRSYMSGVKESNLSNEVTHATCWVHARRKFVKLETAYPDVYGKALKLIGSLYEVERSLAGKSPREIAETRKIKSAEIVGEYFAWLRSFSGSPEVASNSDFRLALEYSLEREESMKVFLSNPSLKLDTNHLEREIRPIAIGRKNWIFCWTELGAESICHAQSLIRTCLLQDVDPRTYLIDVLQRLALHTSENDDVSDLIPRLWKHGAGKTPIPCPCEDAVNKEFSNVLQ